MTDEMIMSTDDPIASDGAPCSIQIVARRFQDEKCLSAARIIDQVLRYQS